MGLLPMTHDLGVIAEVADRVVMTNSDEIVETGTARDLYHDPLQPHTKKLIAANPGSGEMATQLVAGIESIFEVTGLTKRYGDFVALDDVSLIVLPSETVALFG